MNKLILIGNGFDLAHNLKTRYKDFIVWYLYSSLKTLIEKFEVSDELLSSKVGFRGSYPADQFQSVKQFNDYIKLYDIEFNYKHNFFRKLIEKTNEQNWVDIESEYYFSLLELYRTLEKGNIDRHHSVDKDVESLNACFNAIKEKLIEYLITIENSKAEISTTIANHFREEFANQKPNDLGQVLFLNFNYTSTVEKYFHLINPSNPSINYIHGKLNDQNNPIIFGYGDEMDSYYSKIERLNSNEFLKNFKSFGYLKTDNYQKLSHFIDSDRFRVYIMGHSCGISDRVLLNNIFEHKNCSRIKIYYHKRTQTDNDFFEKTQEISRQFKPESKGRMRKIIAPFLESIPLVDE